MVERARSKGKSLNEYQLNGTRKKKAKGFFGLRKRIFLAIIALVIILAVVLFFLLLEMQVITNPFTTVLSKPQHFIVKDSCSLIVGQLIHTIEDEDSCEIRCKTNCEVRALRFYDSEFIQRTNDCNGCDCYCR